MSQVRIQKVIAASGFLSRRKAEEAVLAGRVSVNGVLVKELGTKVDPERDEIRIDSTVLSLPAHYQIILFHKPRKVVTTKFDPENRKTIMDFFPPELQTLKPVGRLDFDSEGLIIMTDDGDLANRIAHPRYGVQKVYQVWTRGRVGESHVQQLVQGVVLEDGPGRFESVKILRQEGAGSHLEVTVSEGRNRFIRRMLDFVGAPVVRLKRIQIGSLVLDNLASGDFKILNQDETFEFRKWLGLEV